MQIKIYLNTIFAFGKKSRKNTPKGCSFVGAEKRILAFSGAPR